MYRDIPEELKELIEPVVEDHALELMNIETVQGAGPTLLKITIDHPSGDGRVPVDQLARLSREVETQLDAADAVVDEYRLEVSSPGLDRMLSREKDFEAARGNEVKLKTRRPIDGRRRFRGVLIEFEAGVACVQVDGAEAHIPFVDIEKANIVYTFSSADFHEGSSGRASER
jgi:ribosome maturation factor RimP